MKRRQFQLGAGAVAALAFVPTYAQTKLKVGRFTSEKRAYSTNNFWVEGSEACVMFDTQFLPSDALKSATEAQKATGKPVKTAIVLHPNPDKFNGTAGLQSRGVSVLTSAQVAAAIPAVHNIRLGWFYKDYQPDYPKDAAVPSVFGSSTQTLKAHGLEVTLHVLGGAGCSSAHVCAQVGDALFVGDLLANRGHAWLELALFDEWQMRLGEVQRLAQTGGVQRIFVGRGEPGGVELITQMQAYLKTVKQIVLAEKPSGELGFLKRRSLKGAITSAFPGYEWDAFVHESLPDIWKKLAG
jgi:glyoxylase-like metal-dependent hydrolase (beta-lactamase superfamily II)